MNFDDIWKFSFYNKINSSLVIKRIMSSMLLSSIILYLCFNFLTCYKIYRQNCNAFFNSTTFLHEWRRLHFWIIFLWSEIHDAHCPSTSIIPYIRKGFPKFSITILLFIKIEEDFTLYGNSFSMMFLMVEW